MITEIKEYIKLSKYREALGLPAECTETYEALAQGEYNTNYSFTHPCTGEKLVFRINLGSQMHLDEQIEYEAAALKLLAESGRTPRVYYVDGSDEAPGNGVLVMEFIPGRTLDYTIDTDLQGAARCLADIHSLEIPEDNGLISPENSLKAILDECTEMLAVFTGSDLPGEPLKKRLSDLLDAAYTLLPEGPDKNNYRCYINTELNSTNFLVDKGSVRLIDWEKPLYGDPAQDLGHFLAPTTTFWKTDIIFDNETIENFISDYIEAVAGRFETEGLRERTLAFITITCLRGMTWCAMAWVQYQSETKALTNESTWRKLNQYLEDDFISLIEKIIDKAAS